MGPGPKVKADPITAIVVAAVVVGASSVVVAIDYFTCIINIFWGGCGGGGGFALTPSNLDYCAFQISTTFYNPQMNTNYTLISAGA